MSKNTEKNVLLLGVLLSVTITENSQSMLRYSPSSVSKIPIMKTGMCSKYFEQKKEKDTDFSTSPQLMAFLNRYVSDWKYNDNVTPKIAVLQQNIWKLFLNWEETNTRKISTSNFVVL